MEYAFSNFPRGQMQALFFGSGLSMKPVLQAQLFVKLYLFPSLHLIPVDASEQEANFLGQRVHMLLRLNWPVGHEL